MRTIFAKAWLVAICGWLFFVNSANAQLNREWSYSMTQHGPATGQRPIIDDSGNVYLLNHIDTYYNGIRVTKVRTDRTVAWQVDYPADSIRTNYFGRSPSGDLYVVGRTGLGSWVTSAIGVKFTSDGAFAWSGTITPVMAPYFGYNEPQAAVDVEGNLWIGLMESPVDSFCIDSLPTGWTETGGSAVMRHAVIHRLESYSGSPALVQRIEGEPMQATVVFQLVADGQGYVNAKVGNISLCCNAFCQGCRDTCFASPFGGPGSTSNVTGYLHRYTTAGVALPRVFLYDESTSQYGASLDIGRTGDLLIFKRTVGATEIVRYGYWNIELIGYVGRESLRPQYPTDYDGNVIVLQNVGGDGPGSYDQTCYIEASSGSIRWTKLDIVGYYGADRDGNILVLVGNRTIIKLDAWGNELWRYSVPYYIGEFFHCDTAGNLYYSDAFGVSKYRYSKFLTLRDARGDSIPDVAFDLIRVTNNPPYFDEDTLGSFTTDDQGRLDLTPLSADSFTVVLGLSVDTLVVGDSLKIATHVYSEPAVKHEALLGTMYSVHLDNMQLAENGRVSFDTLTSEAQDIVLNHTELRYNLLVSVEWEATDSYLWNLEDNFSRMSNFLYDVSDGQIRLDTVRIFDNGEHSTVADAVILASNMEWPRADPGGILLGGGNHLYMPRIWMGDSTRTRNHTDAVYPLDLTNPSHDYRTKVHEFGHYALNFFDEYLFWHPDSSLYSPNNNLRCLPPTVFRYGFMDSHYEDGGGISSEMSGAFRYNLESCRNTNQWRVHGKSCWEHLESWVEAVPWGTNNLFLPILKPDAVDTLERVVTNPSVFFAGPNNDMNNLDYDVGIMVVFPNRPEPQAAGYSDKHVTVHHSTGGDNANVQLVNDQYVATARIIEQGRTSDAARAWIVGVKDASYQILATKGNSGATVTPSPSLASSQNITTGWLYGMADSGGSGVSKVGNRFSASRAEDSLTIELNEVQGNYPLINRAVLTADAVTYDITTAQLFSSDPGLELWPSYGGNYNQTISLSGSGYSAAVSDSLGVSGSFTLWATDDSSQTFFVPNRYTSTGVNHDQSFIWLFGAEGQSEFRLDSANTSLARAIILSSPYPVIRTGLDENAVQAGQTHCLAVFPNDPLIGANQVVIRYDDDDLRLGERYLGDESALAIYRWVDGVTGWQLVGGTVDTSQNVLYAPVVQTGLYAAFTAQIITDVKDDEFGDILPFRFELSQNYPNPFNPITTIKYSLPKRSHVVIEVYNSLGQKVRTLVNREESVGSYTITWNGTNASGKSVSTGVYLYRFQAGEYIETKKMLLLK